MLIFKARRKDPTVSHVLTASERRVMKILGSTMQKVRSDTIKNEDQIIDALRHSSDSKVANLITDQPWFDAQGEIEKELYGELVASGQRTGSSLPKIKKQVLTYRFDAERPDASAWAKKEAANLVVEIVEDQRNTIRDYVAASQMGDFTVVQVARNLRDVVGLTNQQTGWVDNFRNRAISDRMALGDTFERASQRAAASTERYQERIHRYRSETIARTEILRASSEGRNQAWKQGIEEGYISPAAQKQWVTEFDACEICTPLDGESVGISAEFPDGDPPLHPNCRCTVDMVDVDVSDFENMTWDEIDAELDSLLGVTPENEFTELPPPNNFPGDADLYGDEATTAAREYRDEMAAAEPAITRDILELARQYEVDPHGLEFRLKTEESLTRKISSKVTDSEISGNTMSYPQAARSMNDVIRYTYLVDDNNYSDVSKSIIRDLEGKGYSLKVKNYWQEDNTYKGINIAMKDPNGIPVELQFHTPESQRVKDGELHEIYERQRVMTDEVEIGKLNDEMRSVASTIPTPPGDLSFGEQIRKMIPNVMPLWRGAILGSVGKAPRIRRGK